jgi:hypothetical protein
MSQYMLAPPIFQEARKSSLIVVSCVLAWDAACSAAENPPVRGLLS